MKLCHRKKYEDSQVLCQMSKEQHHFIESHKKYHQSISLSRWIILIIFLILWELSVNFRLIDGFFFSSPTRICNCVYELLCRHELLQHCFTTLLETIFSFFLVTTVSILIAALLWYSEKSAEIVEPFLVILNSLPKSALAPLFIVWLGTGMTTIIIAGISVALFGSIINLYTGFKQIDPEKIKLIYTLHGCKRDVFTKVVLPGSVPTLFSTMKVNIGLALVGVIIGEFLSARKGLGYLIIYGSQVFQLNLVISSIIILCFFATSLYLILQYCEHLYKKKY